MGLTQQDLSDLLDVDQGTVSRWERSVERPRPARMARLLELIGPGAASRHAARSVALVRNDLLPATVLDSDLLLTEGSVKAIRHYRDRGRDFARLIGMGFGEFADRSGMPDLIRCLGEADYRRGGAYYFRFTVNLGGRGHTTVAEPLFDAGEFIGSLHYVAAYFDLPKIDGLSLERVDFIPANDECGAIELMRGEFAELIP